MELRAVCMAMGISLDGYGDVGHPHIFLIHGIRHPEVAVLGHAVTLLDAPYILRTIALVVATIAHGRHFALYEVQRGVFVAVLTQRDSQWPTVFRRVIDSGITAIAEPLSPDLGIAIDKTLGTFHRLRPCQATIGRGTGQCMFPKGGNLSVRQRIVAVGLILFVQGNEWVVAVCLLHPLHAVSRVGKDFLTGCLHVLRGLGVEGERTRYSRETSMFRITSIQIDKIDGTQRTVLLHLADDTPNTVTVVGVVLLVEGNAIVAEGKQLATLRDVPADTLVHDGDEVVGNVLAVGLGKALWHLQFRKQHLRVAPCVAVYGCL